MNIEPLTEKAFQAISEYGPKVLTAILVFAIGWVIIQLLLKLLYRALQRSKSIDSTMYTFVLSVARIILFVVLVIICMDLLAVPVTPLITALGAVGLAVSLAVKDSLANLMGGSLLLLSKPIAAGDYCDIGGQSGTVTEIGLVYTALNTVDNKRVFIPNGQVATATIINYSAEPRRRLDLTFSIGYGENYTAARALILDAVKSHPLSLKDPEPVVRMIAHGDNALRITCRVWVENSNYWDLNFDLLEQVTQRFGEAGIKVPYPQMDVHITP